MEFDYTPGDLFKPGPNHSYNACVGKNGGPYDFFAYASGYFRAGNLVLESVVKRDCLLDLLIYPTFYLYRHAFELSLKSLIVKFQSLGEPVSFPKRHELSKLWAVVKPLFERDRKEFDGGVCAIDKMEALIVDMEALDHSAQVFRFPEDRDGQPFLQDRNLINYARLVPMSQAEKVFEHWYYTVESMIEDRNDY
jgi:hypothetical protein